MHKSPELQKGNYLFVHAEGNRLVYELESIGDVYLKLIDNQKDLSFILHHADGRMIEDAKVEMNGKALSFDPSTKTYLVNDFRKSARIQVVYENTAYYFPLRKPFQYRPGIFTTIVHSFPIKNIRRFFQSKDRSSSYFTSISPCTSLAIRFNLKHS